MSDFSVMIESGFLRLMAYCFRPHDTDSRPNSQFKVYNFLNRTFWSYHYHLFSFKIFIYILKQRAYTSYHAC